MRMTTFRRLLFVAAVAATNCVTAAPLSYVSSNTTRDSLRQSTDTAAGMVSHMMDYMRNMIPSIENEVGGLPSTFSSQLSDTETRTTLWRPQCFNKKIALLGTFCVAATTDDDDKDPNHKLPRITFESDRGFREDEQLKVLPALSVKREANSPAITVMLFDDEQSSFPAFWLSVMHNKSCQELNTLAKAAIYEDPAAAASLYGAQIHSFKNIRGRFAHHWHLVALDCQARECPQVQSANVTFFHPNSDGKDDQCQETGFAAGSLDALKDSMMEGMAALSLRNVLNVIGLSPLGVFVLYALFATMLIFSGLFLVAALRAESSRRFLYLNTFFVTCLSSMAYLAMATGNGILVLRKAEGRDGGSSAWAVSNPIFAHKGTAAHPNRMYDAAYGEAPTYPVFYARHINQVLTSTLILVDLFLVSGVSMNTRAFILFANCMMWLCWLAGALITSASRWGFWVFGTCFQIAVLLPLIGVLPTAAARKGRSSRRLYGRLMCITLLTGFLSPCAWLLVEGSHALSSDVAVLLYGVLDVLSQCVFGIILLRKPPPALSDWDQEEKYQTRRLNQASGNGTGGAHGDEMEEIDADL